MRGVEGRPGQVAFQQFKAGMPGNGNGERRGRGQLGNPGNQRNPFVELLLQGEIHESQHLPGDERAKIERINAVYHSLSRLRELSGYRGDYRQNAEVEAYMANRDDIHHVDAAFGLLAYRSRSLDEENVSMLLNVLVGLSSEDDSNSLVRYSGSFLLTSRQNEILEQLTSFLGMPYDRQKTQYTFTVETKFPYVDIFSTVEAPTALEGK